MQGRCPQPDQPAYRLSGTPSAPHSLTAQSSCRAWGGRVIRTGRGRAHTMASAPATKSSNRGTVSRDLCMHDQAGTDRANWCSPGHGHCSPVGASSKLRRVRSHDSGVGYRRHLMRGQAPSAPDANQWSCETPHWCFAQPSGQVAGRAEKSAPLRRNFTADGRRPPRVAKTLNLSAERTLAAVVQCSWSLPWSVSRGSCSR